MAKKYPRIIALVSLLALLVALVPAAGVSAQVPDGIDFNGLFYGDNDYLEYVPLASNPDRGNLYYYEDNTYLYLAVVVLPSVNDNVFGLSKANEPDRAYIESAMWGRHHTADDLIQSDNLEIGFTCNGQAFNWFHGYAYQEAGGAWASGPLDPSTGGGTWPAPMQFASSFAWNMTNTDWDFTLANTRTDSSQWKSVDTGVIGDITDETGWTTDFGDTSNVWYDDGNKWEWAMVYEERLPLSFCQGEPWAITIYSAHNSPSKDGDEDVIIPVYDWGDAPDSYGTTLANNGPRHEILLEGNPILGAFVDAEADGQPGLSAADDDFRPYLIPGFGEDDEDGLQTPLPELEPNTDYTLCVLGTAGAYLDAWLDLNFDGDFDDTGEQIATNVVLNGGSTCTNITFNSGGAVPTDVDAWTYGRFRVASTTAGVTTPYGAAPNGEIEDYLFSNFVPTAVDLAGFEAEAQGSAIEVTWETVEEIDNLGFNLYRAASKADARVKLNDDLIPSLVAPGSPVGAVYTWLDEDVVTGNTYYYWLEDVDASGKTELHGPVTAEAVSLVFEPVQPVPIRRIMPVRLR